VGHLGFEERPGLGLSKRARRRARALSAHCALLGALLLAVACAGPGEKGADEEGIRRQIDSLIEKTNHLDSFLAVYDVHGPGEAAGTLRLAYQAPGSGSFTLEGPSGSAGTWVRDGRVTQRGVERGRETWLATFDARRLWREVEEGFWIALDAECPEWRESMAPAVRKEGEGVHVAQVVSGSGSDKATLRLWMLLEARCPSRLGWLEEFRSSPRRVARTGEDLVLPLEGGARLLVCGVSGFLRDVRLGEGLETPSLTLRALEENPSIDEAVLTPPPAVEESEASRALASTNRAWMLRAWRNDWLRWLEGRIDSGVCEWNEATRGRALRVLQRVYAGLVAEHAEWYFLPKVQSQVGEYAERLATWRMELVDRGSTEEQASAAVRSEIEKWKGPYLEKCARGARERVRELLGETPEPRRVLSEGGFSALDRAALEKAIDEALLPRVDARIEERIGKALARV
jgi:hypothetical protein